MNLTLRGKLALAALLMSLTIALLGGVGLYGDAPACSGASAGRQESV